MRRYTFSRARRSLKHRDFMRLKSEGRAVRTPLITVIIAPGATENSRLGITVGKHVGNACERNRIKRLAREFFRLHRHLLKGHWDMNIIVKKEAAGLDSRRMFSEFNAVFHRLVVDESESVSRN
ncbi:MAG: ribonuclease P protein component [Deltaproteobacteria bacterium]|nr:ribonuclease P protein component [Deltaproteobacteria bacterium]MBW1954701.1 ribonuclease P protein component [Deltaproteobacteria bacterium]MBW2040552.1 ribonuclease P protein component [Deltaproteobacteria bacterium]MBW2131419.1 ribonuclease P protein component [Deltaproteobacteria bacterium]